MNHFNSKSIIPFPEEGANPLGKNRCMGYHYTSPAAFLSIIENKEIRFSDVRYMNDKSEGIYFLKILVEFLEKNKSFPNVQEAVNFLLDQNDLTKIKKLQVLSPIYRDVPKLKYEKSRTFLMCTSRKPDLLNMWNYYIRNNSYEGYCIGFHMPRFLKTFDTKKEETNRPFIVYYGKVIYDRKLQDQQIRKLVGGLEKRPINNIKVGLKHYINTRGYFFKHKSFKGEEEFRVIISIKENNMIYKEKSTTGDDSKLKKDFYIRNGLIVPYLSVSIPEDAISRIYLPPLSEEEIAKKGVQELIGSVGFKDVKICKSQIPVRY